MGEVIMLRLNYLPWYLLLAAVLVTGGILIPQHLWEPESPLEHWNRYYVWLGPTPGLPDRRPAEDGGVVFILPASPEWVTKTAEALHCREITPEPQHLLLLQSVAPGSGFRRCHRLKAPLDWLTSNAESGYDVQDMLLAELQDGNALLYLLLNDSPQYGGRLCIPPRFDREEKPVSAAHTTATALSLTGFGGLLILLPPLALPLFRAFRLRRPLHYILWFSSSPLVILLFLACLCLSYRPSMGLYFTSLLGILFIPIDLLIMAALLPLGKRICAK